MKQLIELLAPAKDYLSAVAAIDAGADAIYIGGARFGARVAATNSVEEISRVVEYAHRFGVRVYATVNTIIFEDELEAARKHALELIGCGVDALIVQDMAMMRMGLGAELHASTQVSNTSPSEVRFLEQVGFKRAILERGLSFEEIRAIREAGDIELECFIHGAICVGYSGRCFLSRSMSAERSGNRGACSQPCRLKWDLTNGRGESYIKGSHLLSVKDMNLTTKIGELLDLGVSSFKIEGRLKDITYIRNVVAWYRAVLDRELAKRPHLKRSSSGVSHPDFEPDAAKSFNRGFTHYMYSGRRGDVASFLTPKAVGEFIGRVKRVSKSWFELDRDHTLKPGDGVCFSGFGTNVNRVEGRRVYPNRMDEIKVGVELSRNSDLKFTQSVERSRMRRVVDAEAKIRVSERRVELTYCDCDGYVGRAHREGSFERALNVEKMTSTLEQQLCKSGDTIFRISRVDIESEIRFLQSSLLSELRREALQSLLAARVAGHKAPTPSIENIDAKYPLKELGGEYNVVNTLSREFYSSHGVEKIEQGYDLCHSTIGKRVMRTPYCIRREIGECLKYNTKIKGDLYLEHGYSRYRLEFDCKRCEMSLIDESKTE